jgi:hypothetical protein
VRLDEVSFEDVAEGDSEDVLVCQSGLKDRDATSSFMARYA